MNKFIFRRRFISIASAAVILPLVVACGSNSSSSGDPSEPAAQPWRDGGVKNAADALSKAENMAKGISVGSMGAQRTAYVIFDPRCPHCAKLWKAAGPIAKEGNIRFVWIPVGVVSRESPVIAAGILDSSSPIAAMDENERLIESKQGGIKFGNLPSEQSLAAVKGNNDMAGGQGLQEVPVVLVKNSKNQPIVTAGSMSQARLREFLAL